MIVYSRQENTNQLADLNIGKFSFNLFRKSLDFPELLSDFNQIIIFEIIHNVFTGLIYSKYYYWRRTLYLQNLFISFFMETMWPVLSVVSLTLWNLLWTWMYLLLSYSSLSKQIRIYPLKQNWQIFMTRNTPIYMQGLKKPKQNVGLFSITFWLESV